MREVYVTCDNYHCVSGTNDGGMSTCRKRVTCSEGDMPTGWILVNGREVCSLKCAYDVMVASRATITRVDFE